MAISSSRVSVSTTATLLVDPGKNRAENRPMRVVIYNAGSTTVYLGGSGVTSSAGLQLATGDTFSADLENGDALYAITASGTQELQVLKSQA